MGPRMVNLSECMDPKRFVSFLLSLHSFLYLGSSPNKLECEMQGLSVSVREGFTVPRILYILWTVLLEFRPQ